uniref:Uncharacterized protein n=1 Tax=Rhizophora mucronata TaxID=61149 RepID=A0A2P2NNI5_RHIMU
MLLFSCLISYWCSMNYCLENTMNLWHFANHLKLKF